MKTFLIGLISFTAVLTASGATADVLGDADDTYIGLQVTLPVAAKRTGILSGKHSFSVMLIDQTDGIKEGIAFNQDTEGIRTIDYVRPNRTFEIGQGRIFDYTIPIVNLSEGAGIRNDLTGGEFLLGLAIGVAVLARVVGFAADEITDCVDPETESEQIAGC